MGHAYDKQLVLFTNDVDSVDSYDKQLVLFTNDVIRRVESVLQSL